MAELGIQAKREDLVEPLRCILVFLQVLLPNWEVVQTLKGPEDAVHALHTFDGFIASGSAVCSLQASEALEQTSCRNMSHHGSPRVERPRIGW